MISFFFNLFVSIVCRARDIRLLPTDVDRRFVIKLPNDEQFTEISKKEKKNDVSTLIAFLKIIFFR